MERAAATLPTSQETQQQRWAWGLWLAMAIVVIAMVLVGKRGGVTGPYRAAASQWLAGGPLYNDDGTGFLYLPSAAILFVPFALLPDAAADTLWRVLTIGTFAAGVWRLTQCSDAGTHARRFLLATLVAVPLSVSCGRNGQSTLLMGGLMMWAAADLATQRWSRSALWLSLAVAVKPLAIVMALLAFALVRPLRWRLAVGMLVLLAAPFLLQRPDYVVGQYRECLDMFTVASHKGQARYWAQLFGMLEVFGLAVPATSQTLLRASFALATLAAAWLAKDRMIRTQACVYLYALSASYLMLFNPRTENSSYALLGPAVGLLLADLLWRHRSYWEAGLTAAAGLAMLGSFEVGRLLVAREKAVWLAPLGAVVFSMVLVAQLRRRASLALQVVADPDVAPSPRQPVSLQTAFQKAA